MIFEKVKSILDEQFGISEDLELTLDTDIAKDLGADSLDIVDLVMSIEDEFKIEVPDNEIEHITTIGDLVNYIKERVSSDED